MDPPLLVALLMGGEGGPSHLVALLMGGEVGPFHFAALLERCGLRFRRQLARLLFAANCASLLDALVGGSRRRRLLRNVGNTRVGHAREGSTMQRGAAPLHVRLPLPPSSVSSSS